MASRWDETWHRLRNWTNGQSPSERLAAQILLNEGYTGLDPSYPLGGQDGGKDAIACLEERIDLSCEDEITLRKAVYLVRPY